AVYYQGERCEQTGVTSSADTWWSQVIERLGGRLLANSSFSGSLVEGAGFPAGNSQERIDALAEDGVQPDVVIVFMGINDYGWGGATAQAAGRGNAVPVASIDAIESHAPAAAAPGAIDRFRAAYGLLLERMRAVTRKPRYGAARLPRTRGRMPEPHVRMEPARRTVQEPTTPFALLRESTAGKCRPRGVRYRLRGRRRHPPHRTGHAPAPSDRVVHRRCRTR
ncbi:MAG: hypothetical protein ACLT98_16305, partial [Eggerthellaceae bacterium]